MTSKWAGLIHVKYSEKRILKRQDKDRVRDRHICPTFIMVLKLKVSFKDAASKNPELSFLRRACTVT